MTTGTDARRNIELLVRQYAQRNVWQFANLRIRDFLNAYVRKIQQVRLHKKNNVFVCIRKSDELDRQTQNLVGSASRRSLVRFAHDELGRIRTGDLLDVNEALYR